MHKVIVCCGVRPDVIKMFSVYTNLKNHKKIQPLLCYSSQHDEMGKKMLKVFDLLPDHYIDTPQFGERTVSWLTARLLEGFTDYFMREKPSLVLAHGDNATGFASALSAYFLNIPVGHVEAGLRTSRFEMPNPEEGIRRMISRISTLHFAPTPKAAHNLYSEGTVKNVHITGNTVVDALKYVLRDNSLPKNKNLIVVTCHRRQNWGQPLIHLCNSIKKIVEARPDYVVYFPVHDNPSVSKIVYEELKYVSNVTLDTCTAYDVFIKKLKIASLVITDSGGVIEEATVLGKPTIILRSEIERPEALEMSGVKLVGEDTISLEETAVEWLDNPPKKEPTDVFGKGTAGETIAQIVSNFLVG
jgi:UDP-N-acetylglucosamine 2-epimerase (non-hydrolysing)